VCSFVVLLTEFVLCLQGKAPALDQKRKARVVVVGTVSLPEDRPETNICVAIVRPNF
jgi:hypothetical protein